MKVIGFTGTRRGMTAKQRAAVEGILLHAGNHIEFHHGDCIGADAQACHIAHALEHYIIRHPPADPKYRAFTTANETRDAKGYIERNHDIVDESSMLIAAPKEASEKLRSGTWATVRYARKTGKPVRLVLPTGKVLEDDECK